MQAPPEAAYIRCSGCGANFGFVPHPGYTRCPYCALDQPVPHELLANLQRYAQAVGGELARANQAYQRAAGFQQWAEESDRAIPRLKVVIPVTGAFMLLVGLAVPIAEGLGVSRQDAGVVATPLLILPVFFLVGYIVWLYSGSGPSARRARASQVLVACPNCGARGELIAGQPAQQCGYCGTALVASAPLMERGIDAAELAYRRARLEEFRQERLGIAGLARYDMSAYVPYFAIIPLLLMCGGYAITFTVEILAGKAEYDPAIVGLWGMFLVVLIALVGTWSYRRVRRTAYHRARSDLGQQFPLKPIEDVQGLVDWLNQNWPAPYPTSNLTRDLHFVAASLEVFGYPALLNARLTSPKHGGPRLHLLLAASRPRSATPGSDTARAVAAALARCSELGFSVASSDAGLLASASAETAHAVRKNPSALHSVAVAFTDLAKAAYAAGSVPAPPL